MNAASQFAEASPYYEDGDVQAGSGGLQSPLVSGEAATAELRSTVSVLAARGEWGRISQLVVIVLHLGVGVIAYQWIFELKSLDAAAQVNSVVDSLYFAVIVFTTVGYGDFVPASDGSKLFTVLFAYIGVWLIASRVSMLVEALLASQEEAIARMLHNDQHLTMEEKSSIMVEQSEQMVCGFQRPDLERLRVSVGLYLLLLGLGCVIFVWLDKETSTSWVDAFYWATITSMTIGFGDYHPLTIEGKLVSCLWIILSVCSFAKVVADFTSAQAQAKAEMAADRIVKIGVVEENFDNFDRDHDGRVSRLDYISRMLVKLEKVTEEEIRELNASFNAIGGNQHPNPGFITKQQLHHSVGTV